MPNKPEYWLEAAGWLMDLSAIDGQTVSFALTLNPSLSELSDIKTAVSEAVTNCIVHAYAGGSTSEKVYIECSADKSAGFGELHIKITDFGCGIEDIDRALTPFYTTLEREERSGMGFTIMQTFMSGFSVKSEKGKGTEVSMFKKIGEMEKVELRERVNA